MEACLEDITSRLGKILAIIDTKLDGNSALKQSCSI